MHLLVLGGYGLIGRHIVAALLEGGHRVTGAGRRPQLGRRLLPEADWIAVDLDRWTRAADWSPALAGIDGVVNAAGALQSGGGTSLARMQRDAVVALVAACERSGVRRFVQISAPGAAPEAETEFLSSKGQADAALRGSGLDWTVLKPGLVVAAEAYGGTSLLRALAACPLVQPLALPEARMQTLGAGELAAAVRLCLERPELARRDFDLVEEEPHSLRDIVLAFRGWLGFPPPRLVLAPPRWLTAATARLADLAGLLGWPAPLRSTALRVLGGDVLGDPEPWRRATGRRFSPLPETLRRLPSTRQERVYARAQLVFPPALAVLAAFWILSGALGLLRLEATAEALPAWLGRPAVALGALLDLAVGLALLFRRSMRPACLASLALSLAYLLCGSLLLPQLWLDPLGPLLKVFPTMALALLLAALAERR